MFHQRGDGLDERLAAAFTDLGGPTVIIGMDTPQVDAMLLDATVSRSAPRAWTPCSAGPPMVATGPSGCGAPPGGAAGCSDERRHHTHRAQRERLDQLGLVTATVAELTDLDTYDEAVAVAAVATGVRFRRTVEEIDRQLGSAGHR